MQSISWEEVSFKGLFENADWKWETNMGRESVPEARPSNTKWTVTNSTLSTWNTKKIFIPGAQVFSPWDILDEKVRQVSRNKIVHTLEGQEQHFEDNPLIDW